MGRFPQGDKDQQPTRDLHQRGHLSVEAAHRVMRGSPPRLGDRDPRKGAVAHRHLCGTRPPGRADPATPAGRTGNTEVAKMTMVGLRFAGPLPDSTGTREAKPAPRSPARPGVSWSSGS